MDTRRVPTWMTDLEAFLESRRNTPYEWGVQDCALFCADAVKVMTGIDFGVDYRGKYHDEAGATALLEEAGGMEALVTKFLGDPLPSVGLAKRGDVVMVISDFGPSLGICNGRYLILVADDGLEFHYPLRRGVRAWHV